MPLFIARRVGSFVEPPNADQWQRWRYRSRRDFLRFAEATPGKHVAVHKRSAIEKTLVFPVQPVVSFVFVRAAVFALLACVAGGVTLALR